MEEERIENETERLLRSCAITAMLKGFYPLRDLILLYYYGRVSPEHPQKATAMLTPAHGKNCRADMRRALHHSWLTPGCRLTEYMEDDLPDGPPTPDLFAQAVSQRMKKPSPQWGEG